MTDEYTQYVKVTSTDGRNTVESIINDLRKKCDKGKVEFGVDVDVTRVSIDEIKDSEDYE